jgi:hypothetical protein
MIGDPPSLTIFVPWRAGVPIAYPFLVSSRTAVR